MYVQHYLLSTECIHVENLYIIIHIYNSVSIYNNLYIQSINSNILL